MLTDLYELTMGQAYFDQGMFEPATFSLFIRKYPANRGYFVAAGLEDVLVFLENFRFSSENIDYIRSTNLFSEKFIDYLARMRFTGDVFAIPEGRLFFKNEFKIHDAVQNGARIDAFGVGTKMGVSADAPYTDMAYKLVEYADRPVLKLSTGKQSLPGKKQVFRVKDGNRLAKDVVDRRKEIHPGEPLLLQVMERGKRLQEPEALDDIRQRFLDEIEALEEPVKRIESPDRYTVQIGASLQDLTDQVRKEQHRRQIGPE